MFNLPFFNYPYNYPYYRNYRNYNKYNSYYNNSNNSNNSSIIEESVKSECETKKEKSITNSNRISNTINSILFSNYDSDQAIFEIFGIKLYLDDLIILGLLFFLYQQNVKDEMLYIILFLLLFS